MYKYCGNCTEFEYKYIEIHAHRIHVVAHRSFLFPSTTLIPFKFLLYYSRV